MIREFARWTVSASALLFALTMANAEWDPGESGTMDAPLARDFVEKLTQAVEAKALKARDQDQYDQEKAALYRALGDGLISVDRKTMYEASRRLLNTLDTDGHTILWSREQLASFQAATSPTQAAASNVAQSLSTGKGAVLVVRPPQTTFTDSSSTAEFARTLLTRINEEIERSASCALVVDLSDQKGGNAWPPLAALGALTTTENGARWVDRDGKRTPIMVPNSYQSFVRGLGPLPSNPLTKFAGTAIGVVMRSDTASAGEMLAIILRGEPRSRLFGMPSYGATTGNVMYPLPDGATVLLTMYRYALGTDGPIRGKLLPDSTSIATADPEATVLAAAEWASEHSAACSK